MKTIFMRIFTQMTRTKGLHVQAVLFFALGLSVFVFAIGSEPAQLNPLIPGLVWALLLLASLLGLPDLLDRDLADGTLDDFVLSAHPLPALMAAKMMAHFGATMLPVALAGTLCAEAMMPAADICVTSLLGGLVLGGLAFSAIGLLGAALVLGSARASMLLAVIVMPLCIPPLIFGAAAAAAPLLGLSATVPMALLAALACASVTLAPFAAAAIVRMKVTTL